MILYWKASFTYYLYEKYRQLAVSALVALKIAGKVPHCPQTLSKAEVIKDTRCLHVLKSTITIHLYEIFDQLQTLKKKKSQKITY